MNKIDNLNQKSRISDELRRSIIIAINNGIATKKVSALYNVKLSTVYNINTIYKKEGRVKKLEVGGDRKSILNLSHKNFINNLKLYKF